MKADDPGITRGVSDELQATLQEWLRTVPRCPVCLAVISGVGMGPMHITDSHSDGVTMTFNVSRELRAQPCQHPLGSYDGSTGSKA